jgi:hypothetical protein
MKRTSRKPSNLSESLQRYLNAYALAASAAGVGVLAVAQPAAAKIIYTPANKSCSRHGLCFKLDLNHDNIIDFRIVMTYWTKSFRLLIDPAKDKSKNQVWGEKLYTSGGRRWYASRLRR